MRSSSTSDERVCGIRVTIRVSFSPHPLYPSRLSPLSLSPLFPFSLSIPLSFSRLLPTLSLRSIHRSESNPLPSSNPAQYPFLWRPRRRHRLSLRPELEAVRRARHLPSDPVLWPPPHSLIVSFRI